MSFEGDPTDRKSNTDVGGIAGEEDVVLNFEEIRPDFEFAITRSTIFFVKL